MKKSLFLILVLAFFIALPSYSNPAYEENNFIKSRRRFERIDKNSDGLISKGEMIEAHLNRIEKLFMKFDKNLDDNLSKKELRSLRKEMKKKISKSSNNGE